MLAKRGTLIQEGDTVLVFHGHDDIRPLRVQRGLELHCKAGRFRHDAIIGQPYGTRVAGSSNVKTDATIPTILIMQNAADLWTFAVPHRTQIIYTTDISVIIMNCRIIPGSFVAEAGTGSGSLTHSLARAVAPHGRVYTFDFHKQRALQAREEFIQNGVSHLVSSGWRDVCSTGNGEDERGYEWWHPSDTEPRKGFGLPSQHVDAVFLDVPAPWAAVENVLQVLKPGGILCTFSPCIEQTQRTCDRLRQDPSEFIDIRTVEALTKYFDPVYRRTRLADEETCQATTMAPVEEGAEAASEEEQQVAAARKAPKRPRYQESVHFKPAACSKGHSAYLTFARRRLPRLEVAPPPPTNE